VGCCSSRRGFARREGADSGRVLAGERVGVKLAGAVGVGTVAGVAPVGGFCGVRAGWVFSMRLNGSV